MKKYVSIMIITLLLMSTLVSCKKSSTTASTPKDYAASIKDKTWWGMMTYTGKPLQYYSVHFNTDSSLLWSQLAGDDQGKWTINGKQLIMTFFVSNVKIKADISETDTLMNISASTGSYVINSGKLIANPPIPLDNTTWRGTESNGAGTPYQLQMSFMPTLRVGLSVIGGSSFYATNIPYTLSGSGVVMRAKDITYNDQYFGVIVSGSQMKGTNANLGIPWLITKQ